MRSVFFLVAKIGAIGIVELNKSLVVEGECK